MNQTRKPLLSVRDFLVHLRSSDGTIRAVDGVSFDIHPGETFGLVGESGCGKSITALSLLGLTPSRGLARMSGEALFEGRDLLKLPPADLRDIRGDRIGMIFQEPMTSLNPVLKAGFQISEALMRHRGLGARAARREAVDLLGRVGIPSPAVRANEFPHRLSGGMRQRVMIAMAIACRPKLLIADEPTTALDVTIQAQILELILDLKAELGMAVLLITHNFGIVAQSCERTAVMYAGRIVEDAPTVDLFEDPRHPYTRGLLGAIPRLGEKLRSGRRPLREIPGMVPRIVGEACFCRFAPRCELRFDRCVEEQPGVTQPVADHRVRCFAQEPGVMAGRAAVSETAA
jgi:peptide/nickel transport system ATP-binding protein